MTHHQKKNQKNNNTQRVALAKVWATSGASALGSAALASWQAGDHKAAYVTGSLALIFGAVALLLAGKK